MKIAAFVRAGVLFLLLQNTVVLAAAKMENMRPRTGDTITTEAREHEAFLPYITASVQLKSLMRNYLLQSNSYIRLESFIKARWREQFDTAE